MPLISSPIPNLANGISQQPDVLRLASQGELQLNGYSSIVDGLGKRPPLRYISKLVGVSGSAFIHTINRDAVERYKVAIDTDGIKVFDVDGNAKTVNAPSGFGYLAGATPREDYRCITVADFTFVLNTNKTVAKDVSVAPARNPEALVWVKQGTYGGVYRVIIDGAVAATYTVPDGSTASHATNVKTAYIAGQLRTQINTNLPAYTVNLYGSTLYIRRDNNADFDIRTEGPVGDTALQVIKGKVQRFSDLPTRAVNGFEVEIAGDNASTFDNYYVAYDTTGTSTTDGIWLEVPKGGDQDTIDAATMPHALVREADGSFTFREIEWGSRLAGDADSSPFPSFVGRRLNDIFFHRNRLGFVADENVVFSQAGGFYNFFRGTATAVLDDDPIDVGISHVKVSLLRHALPFNETLLLFSDQTQFQLGESQLLTPQTISINQTTEYECSTKAKPVGVGKFVYFPINRGTYSGLREYFVDKETESEDASEITAHVPKFLRGQVTKIASSSNEEILAVLTEDSPSSVYIYKFYFSKDEKLQASWSEWKLGAGDVILNCDFIETKLYVTVNRSDGVHLEVLNLEPEAVETGWTIQVHLDSLVESADLAVTVITDTQNEAGVYPTEVILPYTVDDPSVLQVVTGPGGPIAEGTLLPFTVDNTGATSVLTVDEDLTGQPFFVGKKYNFRYIFSTFLIKENTSSGGQISISQGRLQLRRAAVIYANTGYFRVLVRPLNRDEYTYPFSGRVLGASSNIMGKVALESGTFNFPVISKNDRVEIELTNDSFLPCQFLSAEWEGFFHLRSQRV